MKASAINEDLEQKVKVGTWCNSSFVLET